MKGLRVRMAAEGILVGLGVVIGETVGWVLIGVFSLVLAVEAVRWGRERWFPPSTAATAALGAPDRPAREFLRRDDPAELAQRCHMLAGSIERWVKAFQSGHSERAEKMVAQWLDADPSTDPAEARRRAYTRDEKNWEDEYALRYRAEAKTLFDRAYEMHEIAKEHEQLATQPLAIQFPQVPKLFNEIADSIYGEVK